MQVRFKPKLILILLLCFSFASPALAYYPKASLKFKNLKLKNKDEIQLEEKFLEFFAEYPEVLKEKGKEYKVDQYCKLSMELNEEGLIDINSIQLLESAKNFAYNLKLFDFLRGLNRRFVKKEADEPVVISFKYYAF